MLLAIDVGNTQTHLGGFRGDELAEHWRFQTRAGATGDELAERIAGLLGLSGIERDEIDALCRLLGRAAARHRVRGDGRALLRRAAACGSARGSRPGCRSGSTTRYEVGADRLVNAVAAYERVGGACVVVDFGTGINFDAVSADGEYLGGAIAPGVEISLTALDRARRADPADRARRARSPRSASRPGRRSSRA